MPSISTSTASMNALSDDEVVYLEGSLGSPSVDGALSDDGDFVLVPHTPLARSNPPLPVPAAGATTTPIIEETGADEVAQALAALSLTRAPQPGSAQAKPAVARLAPTTPTTPTKGRNAWPRKGRNAAPPSPTPSTPTPGSPAPSSGSSRSARRRRAAQQSANTNTGLGGGVVDDMSDTTGLSVVDDWSDTLSELSYTDNGSEAAAVNDEALVKAQKYIASYIANPPPVASNGTLLPLLQALIVELGILSPSPSTPAAQSGAAVIPRTLTAARALIKARVFVSIREYLTAREDGPAALAKIMHPSRSALVKALRKGKSTRVRKDWVKKSGLSVLLVQL